MKGDLHSVRILRRGGAPEAAKDNIGRIPSDLQPEGVGRGFDIDVEMDAPGNDIDEQVASGGWFSTLALDEDNDSGHGQSDSKDYASDAKEPAGSSNNLPAPAWSYRPKYDHLLRLHDPYRPGLSYSKFGALVRHSLTMAPTPPTPLQNQAAGQAITRKLPRSFRRKDVPADLSDLFLAPNETSVNALSQTRINHSKIGDIHGVLRFDPTTRYDPRLLGNDNASWWGQHARYQQGTPHAKIQKLLGRLCDAEHGRMEIFDRHQYSFTE